MIDSRSYVYFIGRSDGEGPVKIGVSESPENSLAALAVWSPYPLKILASMPGDFRLERRFHTKFLSDHSHKDWFMPSKVLFETIDMVARGVLNPDDLPAPHWIRPDTYKKTPIANGEDSPLAEYIAAQRAKNAAKVKAWRARKKAEREAAAADFKNKYGT